MTVITMFHNFCTMLRIYVNPAIHHISGTAMILHHLYWNTTSKLLQVMNSSA